jgi:hypothetical protein
MAGWRRASARHYWEAALPDAELPLQGLPTSGARELKDA